MRREQGRPAQHAWTWSRLTHSLIPSALGDPLSHAYIHACADSVHVHAPRRAQSERQTGRHTHTQTHRHTDTQTHRKTDSHTHARTRARAHTHTHTHIHTHTHTQGSDEQHGGDVWSGRDRRGKAPGWERQRVFTYVHINLY